MGFPPDQEVDSDEGAKTGDGQRPEGEGYVHGSSGDRQVTE